MKLFYLYAFVILFAACKSKFDKHTYSENKQSLSQKEQTNPQEFLKIFAKDRKNLFGATIVKGTIENNASICAYKNTRIKMLCYHNNIRVEEHENVFDDIIKPGTSQGFKIKYHLPKGTDSIALSVMNATPVLTDTLK